MAQPPTEALVLEALRRVQDPDRGQDIVALGMVKGLVVKDGNVFFSIEVDAKRGPGLEPMRKAAEKAGQLGAGKASAGKSAGAKKPARRMAMA